MEQNVKELLKDKLFLILMQYAFDSDLKNYIDKEISIFSSTLHDIICNIDDNYMNLDKILDKLLEIENIFFILDLVYYEVQHYYDF